METGFGLVWLGVCNVGRKTNNRSRKLLSFLLAFFVSFAKGICLEETRGETGPLGPIREQLGVLKAKGLLSFSILLHMLLSI